MSADLRKTLFGEKRSIVEKISDFVVGSQEIVARQGQDYMEVIDRPDIISRMKGDKDNYYLTKKEADPNKVKQTLEPIPAINTETRQPLAEILNPKRESLVVRLSNLLNKNKQEAAVITSQPAIPEVVEPVKLPEENRLSISKDNLVFQESTIGDGLPYIVTPTGSTSLKDVYQTYKPKPLEKPINKIVIHDPHEGTYIIDTPEKLAIANEIKAISDEVAPEYTNYLLKLAQKEGGYDHTAFRGESQNPGGGDDRGIFQINSKAFPTVTNEMAQDIRFSVLWAISLIQSANPKKGDGRYTGQEKWMADPSVRRSTITIE